MTYIYDNRNKFEKMNKNECGKSFTQVRIETKLTKLNKWLEYI